MHIVSWSQAQEMATANMEMAHITRRMEHHRIFRTVTVMDTNAGISSDS